MSNEPNKLNRVKMENSSIAPENFRPVTPDFEECMKVAKKDRAEQFLKHEEAERQKKQALLDAAIEDKLKPKSQRRSTTPLSDDDALDHRKRIEENKKRPDSERYEQAKESFTDCGDHGTSNDRATGRDSFDESDDAYEIRRQQYLDNQQLQKNEYPERDSFDESDEAYEIRRQKDLDDQQLQKNECKGRDSFDESEDAYEIRRQKYLDDQQLRDVRSSDSHRNSDSRDYMKRDHGKATTQYHEVEDFVETATEHDDQHIRGPNSVDYENGGYSYQNNRNIIDSYEIEHGREKTDAGNCVTFNQQQKNTSSESEDYLPMRNRSHDEQQYFDKNDEHEKHGDDYYHREVHGDNYYNGEAHRDNNYNGGAHGESNYNGDVYGDDYDYEEGEHDEYNQGHDDYYD